MPATMTILGLFEADNNVLFPLADAMPTSEIAEAVLTGVLTECSSLEVVYPVPSVFQKVLEAWCKYRRKVWADLYATVNLQYNPINNYDRTETETIERDNKARDEDAESVNRNRAAHDDDTGTVQHSNRQGGTDATITRQEFKYGFNSTVSKVPTSEVLETPSDYVYNNSDTETRNLDRDYTQQESEKRNAGKQHTSQESETRTLRNSGNIGVTTTQEMIEQQRNVVRYDFVEDVINDFKSKFCLMVY